VVSPLPGAVGISGLRVYDWPTADGLCGGSPHVHLTCAEAYVVVAGKGSVQTLTCDGFAETTLTPGTVAWFTPGTVHRLVNGDGGLHIVVVMQNSGLPEAGDAVFTFPPETLKDTEAYARAAALDPDAPQESARRRRDLALEGYAALRARLDAGDPTPLQDFYRSAVRLKEHLFAEWEQRWRAGAFAEALQTAAHLSHLRAGNIDHLTEAAVHRLEPPPERAYGMCGRLDTYVP
jgi:mannose-6-phosphate isomerase-like protein (cupin superfamily)